MQSAKRIELVIAASVLEQAIELLEKHGIDEYTIIENVLGRGDRGTQDGLGLSDAFTNTMLIWVGEIETFDRVKEPLREFLKNVGGMCSITDAAYIRH